MSSSSTLFLRLSSFALVFCIFFSSSVSAQDSPNPKLKAVNLGGWLVVEGWIKPSLFDGILNNDLLDGTQVQIKSVKLGKYLSAENGGGTSVVCNRNSASGWETFRLWRITETNFQFRVFNEQFMGLNGNNVVAVVNPATTSETFQIIRSNGDRNRVHIKAPNGMFLQAKTEDQVTADFQGTPGWGDDSPAVFLITIVNSMRGEYQLTNGYGPDKAPQVMHDHWNSYITEDDFIFMSQKGINALRIPVGWWIASDPNPPKPFVGGSLDALDRAFSLANKYGLKVIVDLHAAKGSQNGNDHSGTRDGIQGWGKTQENIDQTVGVIDFLASRYGQHPSLIAIELINEPLAPGVSLDSLTKYYKAGYAAVRKYTSDAYVIMSNRLGPADSKELFPTANGLRRVVIDVHYYNLFSDRFNGMTVQQNVDFINNNRTSQLSDITTTNGPLTFVGEWVAEWAVQGASMADYQRFAQAQLDVYGHATFGWAYWTFKNVQHHWSLRWMINNSYIQL